MSSALQPYSLGYVVTDIEEDNLYLNVFPVELMAGFTGDINETKQENVTATNADGELSNIIVNKSVKILAKWLPNGNANRLTPPNVCAGETVRLYRFGNTDRFYWTTLYNEIDLRRNEKATWIFSNKKEPTPDDESALEKIYYFTIDTINKFIRLHTDDSDEEFTTYDIDIDTKNGKFVLVDGRKNGIELDSSKDVITINTKKKVVITPVEEMSIATKLYKLTATDGIEFTTDAGFKIKLATLSITNDTGELISIIVDLLDAMLKEKHIGNLGAPTALDPGTISAYTEIKTKIESFME